MLQSLFRFCGALLVFGLLSANVSAAEVSVQSLASTVDSSGRATIRIPARSIYQYSPMIVCDSFQFRMSHFSSYFEAGTLTVDLRYVVRPNALGTSCTVFFVEDRLEDFDFASGEALTVAPQSYRFVINR